MCYSHVGAVSPLVLLPCVVVVYSCFGILGWTRLGTCPVINNGNIPRGVHPQSVLRAMRNKQEEARKSSQLRASEPVQRRLLPAPLLPGSSVSIRFCDRSRNCRSWRSWRFSTARMRFPASERNLQGGRSGGGRSCVSECKGEPQRLGTSAAGTISDQTCIVLLCEARWSLC